ncbi:hypothetical protein CV093_02950 [Oceanobacillus sp. 143]|nr:hypothetical protein CV093_02950 [Oceanobacillus sp. 143]
MSTAMEIEASEAQFKQWTNKYFALMDELEKMGEETEEEKISIISLIWASKYKNLHLKNVRKKIPKQS